LDSQLLCLSTLTWLHLLATIAWLGSLFTYALIIEPVLRRNPESLSARLFRAAFLQQFRIVVYVSLGVLLITGTVMMLGNRHYAGLLHFGTLWTFSILIKHFLVLVLIGINVYQLQYLAPRLTRPAAPGNTSELATVQKQLKISFRAGLIIGALILLFTAIPGAMSAGTW
jgi:uncharacterized membrane protein